MGLLDKLMFWKRDTTTLDYSVEGCFTLPETVETEDDGSSTAQAAPIEPTPPESG